MKRRDILRYTTTATVVPAVVGAQQKRKAPGAAPPSRSAASPSAWKPAFLTPAQNETVIVLTDLIIPATDTPGAREAKVNQYVDLFLLDGPERERTRFLEGLTWLDEYATRRHGQPFAKLSAADQTAILTALDANADSGVARGHEFFRMAKQLTSRIYYNTAVGYRELNKGGRIPTGFGCSHDGHA